MPTRWVATHHHLLLTRCSTFGRLGKKMPLVKRNQRTLQISIHDNILYGYAVMNDQDQSRSYTITFYTEFLDSPSIEYTDVVFTGVVAHYFENELPNSILFDIEQSDLKSTYELVPELFERLTNYGWPCPYTTLDDLFATLEAKHIQAFLISASYGLDGWVWAEEMNTVQRVERKTFD
jgi:hypothetical protein